MIFAPEVNIVFDRLPAPGSSLFLIIPILPMHVCCNITALPIADDPKSNHTASTNANPIETRERRKAPAAKSL
jgi:hypothetical protein